MINKISLAFLLLFLGSSLAAQRNDAKLEARIRLLLNGFRGKSGVFVVDLKKNKTVAINADSLFPTASVVKIPIMIGIMDKIRRNELGFHQVMVYKDSLFYDEGEDILASFKPEQKISISKLLMLSLSTSDNTASLWLQGLAGGGGRINEIMDSLGFANTRVNSRVPTRTAQREKYGWGQTTPREMGLLMQKILNREIFSDSLSVRMLRLLGRQYWDEEAISQIPPNIFVADKSGAVNESRNEVLYVNGPHPYIFCIFTKENADQSWEENNEAWVLTRKLSALLWNYYKEH